MKLKNLLMFVLFFIAFSCDENINKQQVTNTVTEKLAEEPESWDNISEDSVLIEYFQFIDSKYLNKKQTVKNKYGKEDITYLGSILKQNGDVVSYVIALYYEVQAAIQIHGHSNIIFIQKDRKLAKRFDLAGPEELPYKLEKNILYFHYTDSTEKSKIFVDTIGTKLPKLICVGPENCH